MSDTNNSNQDWRRCRPVLIDPETGIILWSPRLEMAWSAIPADDRRLFHEFSCLKRYDAEALAAVERIRGIILIALAE